MNRREKLLAAGVAGVLVVILLWTVVRWGVVARWENLREDIAKAQKKGTELRTRLTEARTAEGRWADIHPISHNPEVGAQRFNDDIAGLLARHGLVADRSIRKLPARKLKNSGFTEVRVSVSARGSLRQLMDFLCDFYRREYPARLDQINLTSEDQGRRTGAAAMRSRGRSSGARGETTPATPPGGTPDSPRLNLTITASALVLPMVGKLEQKPADPLEPEDAAEWGRLPRGCEEYDTVVAQNLFKVWQPTLANPGPQPIPDRGPVPPPPPPPPQQPKGPDKAVIAVMSTSGELEALVRDPEHKEQPSEKIGINDRVDDGTLVLVLPRAMVVQVPGTHADGGDCKYYLYKLGSRFSERVLLDPVQYPEIQRQLNQALGPR